MTNKHADLEIAATVAKMFDYGGWVYERPEDRLASGRIRGSDNGPCLAVVQWPVPTMDYALCGIDPSAIIGEFIAAANPQTIIDLLSELNDVRWKLVYAQRALEKCDYHFDEIRNDWSDPRSDCRAGSAIVENALSIIEE